MATETFMEATELHFEMTVKDSETYKVWNEKMEETRRYDAPTTNEEALQIAQEIVKDFNKSLRPREAKRKLVNVQRVETKVIDLMEQKFD